MVPQRSTGVVVLTGAAGGVARQLLPGIAECWPLRLTDRLPVPAVASAEARIGELTDPDFVDSLLAGADAVVHLAGNPDPGATWEQLYEPNIVVPTTLLEAAGRRGVRRVVLASSAHATGQRAATPDAPPCCLMSIPPRRLGRCLI